jgi:hypothetical protein
MSAEQKAAHEHPWKLSDVVLFPALGIAIALEWLWPTELIGIPDLDRNRSRASDQWGWGHDDRLGESVTRGFRSAKPARHTNDPTGLPMVRLLCRATPTI